MALILKKLMDKIKQAVLLAAGESSRFKPLSFSRHKSETPLFGKTLLEWTINSLEKLGIEKIIIVHSASHKPDCKVYKNLKIKLISQTSPQGMGDALLCAEKQLDNYFMVLFPYHVDCGKAFLMMLNKWNKHDGVMLLTEPVKGKVGIAQYKNGKVSGVQEKAYNNEENTYNISGLYILSREYLNILKKQKDHHYNFESALNELAQKHNLTAYISNQKLLSLKYPWHLFDFRDYFFKNFKPYIHSSAVIDKTAILENDLYIDKGVKIGAYSIIRGPAYIGRNVFIGDHALLRDKSVVEEGSVVGAYTDVKSSIILENTHVHGYLADSILGREVRIAHGFISANRRLDRDQISVQVDKEKINTGKTSLGTIIGDKTSLGIKVGTMPGVLIGGDSVVGPGTLVFKNVPANSRCY